MGHIWTISLILQQGFERGILWEYDPSTDEWARGGLIFKMEAVRGVACGSDSPSNRDHLQKER